MGGRHTTTTLHTERSVVLALHLIWFIITIIVTITITITIIIIIVVSIIIHTITCLKILPKAFFEDVSSETLTFEQKY